MKLEPKHLVPYLLYDLKLIWKDGYIRNLCYTDIETMEKIGRFDSQHEILLRPLSDLTKEIEPIKQASLGSKYLNFRGESAQKTLSYLNGSYDKIPYGLMQLLLEDHYDVFGLIEQGLAIDMNTLKEKI